MKTLLVMTGVTTKKELLDPAQKIHPCYWADNFGDLADAEKA
jgi:ribonucleotide monophosphatase NagD (HAD superfamily)